MANKDNDSGEEEALKVAKKHPVLRQLTKIDEMTEALRSKREDKEFKIQELDKWKECVLALAGSTAGQMFLQNMNKFSGHNDPVNTRDAHDMAERAIKSAFYLKWIRPFLSPEQRSTVE